MATINIDEKQLAALLDQLDEKRMIIAEIVKAAEGIKKVIGNDLQGVGNNHFSIMTKIPTILAKMGELKKIIEPVINEDFINNAKRHAK